MRRLEGQPYLIAELGVNHDGNVARAVEMASAAADAGFDAVKLQYWLPEELLARRAPNAAYQGPGDQHELLASLRLTVGELVTVREVCRRNRVDFGVTPDGALACRDVLTAEVDFLKVGSGDADNPWLLEAASVAPVPLVISLGMTGDADASEIARRVDEHPDVTFLHCVSAYPTPLAAANLGRIQRLAQLTRRPVGLSDHTQGVEAAIAAVAVGAVVVEKHVTYDTSASGPDHHMSLALAEASGWVAAVRATASAFSAGVESDEELNRSMVRKGLYPTTCLPEGHVVGQADLVPLRPVLDGIPALERDRTVGRRLARAVTPDNPLRREDLA
ncbi:MAG: N-acetylneuraminate synthase family protein [Actinomycetota bacterium]|nr:N-acetylneuraminate synthase family protein [Actinomycetota bacterium]